MSGLGTQSRRGLDWPALLTALAEQARTPMGAAAVRALRPLEDLDAVARAYDATDELRLLEDEGTDVAVGAVRDIRREAVRARKGEVLEAGELRQAGHSLQALAALRTTLGKHAEDAPTLDELAAPIEVDEAVAHALVVAFDARGELSADTYPQLGTLRRRIAELHDRLRGTLDTLLRGDELAPVLQDRFWTQRGNRYVLPIKANAKRWDLGIVHGVSGTGQTVFVEPHQVVEVNNRLRIAEAELLAEEQRILADLSARLGSCSEALAESLAAVEALDVVCARDGLARRLEAERPHLATGALDLRVARHPLLVLRGVPVVGNDLALSPERPALVISGANAGGKTVALKTVGLCALLVQHGCFLPAAPTSTVGLFTGVYAVIGDAQTVEGDLSSFAGHIVALREVLERVDDRSVVLLDELASGTDPAQGSALAVALLEALLDAGPRVLVTTHYARLKGLAASDERFGGAAMEIRDGTPTYRVLADATGESHALQAAAHLGIPADIVARAEALLGGDEGTLTRALSALEEARARAEATARELAELERQVDAERDGLARQRAELKRRSAELEQQGADAFLSRLQRAETAIGQVVAGLQRDPGHEQVKAARQSLDALRGLVPARPAPAPQGPAPALRVGDRVQLKGLGRAGEVVAVGDGTVRVRAGGLTVNTPAGAVEVLERPRAQPVHRGGVEATLRTAEPELTEALRMDGNTLDLRGTRVDEAQDQCDGWFDRCVLEGHSIVFLLHGHGTGALKVGLRRWLSSSPYVRSWVRASEEQGGDAFTVVWLVE